MAEIILNPGERLEHLGGGIHAVVSKAHAFGTDAMLLAHFSQPKKGWRLCDLGTGSGIIPLLWCKDGEGYRIDACEIQPGAADMARRAVALNSLDISIYNIDMREIGTDFNHQYDLVACNPPYSRAGASLLNPDTAFATARHEIACTLEDVIVTAARLLKFGGRLCMCHKPERLADIVTLMRAHGVEPKRMRFAQKRAGAKPWLLLIEGRRGGRPELRVEPTLIAEEGGELTEEMRLIYGNYRI